VRRMIVLKSRYSMLYFRLRVSRGAVNSLDSAGHKQRVNDPIRRKWIILDTF
jgi:hypothetical protein